MSILTIGIGTIAFIVVISAVIYVITDDKTPTTPPPTTTPPTTPAPVVNNTPTTTTTSVPTTTPAPVVNNTPTTTTIVPTPTPQILVKEVIIRQKATAPLDYVHFAEIEVFDEKNINVANKGTASQSSNYSGGNFPASNAIDGNFTNFSHTNNAANTWWKVSFNPNIIVKKIIFSNRTDCCQEKSLNYELVLVYSDNTMSTPIPLTVALKQTFNF